MENTLKEIIKLLMINMFLLSIAKIIFKKNFNLIIENGGLIVVLFFSLLIIRIF